jgi:ankyrin repeat protein
MIRPAELATDLPHGPWSCRGSDVWEVLCAAANGDVVALQRLLAADPNLHRAEYFYTQPIHLAVREGRLDAVRVLLEVGADPAAATLSGDDLITVARDRGHEPVARLLADARARRGRNPPADRAVAVDFEPIDLALWKGPWIGVRGDLGTARNLVAGGLQPDLVILTALGDLAAVNAALDQNPTRIHEARPWGKRPLSTAVEFGHRDLVDLLLERGADPNWPEGPSAPRGAALHVAAGRGDRQAVELLLRHGADPNSTIDSAGSATYAAKTKELRDVLVRHGGVLDPFDLVWLDEDEEALRRVIADPRSADAGCGGVLAAACTLGKRDLVVRLLEAGVRVPKTLTACRSYLLEDPDLLGLLLASGICSPSSIRIRSRASCSGRSPGS